MRALAVESGIEQPNWKRWVEATVDRKNEPVLDVPVAQENVADWAEGLDLPIGGETILFVDCEAAFYRTSVARARPPWCCKPAGVEFGLMAEQWCCGGPAAEMGYVDQARAFAEHNVADWRAVGAQRIITLDPHDYITLHRGLPRLLRRRLRLRDRATSPSSSPSSSTRAGSSSPQPIERVVTYHDPCRLNKRKGICESPREILRAIPGLTFKDVDRVTQWSYCSGAGAGLAIEKPEITAEISRRRVAKAAELDVDTLVSACVWSERPLSERAPSSERRARRPRPDGAGRRVRRARPRGVHGAAGPQQERR